MPPISFKADEESPDPASAGRPVLSSIASEGGSDSIGIGCVGGSLSSLLVESGSWNASTAVAGGASGTNWPLSGSSIVGVPGVGGLSWPLLLSRAETTRRHKTRIFVLVFC